MFASKQRPKKITLRGSDGREYAFIAKGSEDLRQDDRIERLFSAMDGLFAEHPAAKRRGLHARTFHVAPLSRRAGLLEFVGGTKPMLEALGARTKSGDAVGTKHQHWIKAQALHPAGKRSGFARRRDAPGAKLSAPAGAAIVGGADTSAPPPQQFVTGGAPAAAAAASAAAAAAAEQAPPVTTPVVAVVPTAAPVAAGGACAGKVCPAGYEMLDRGDRCTCRPLGTA